MWATRTGANDMTGRFFVVVVLVMAVRRTEPSREALKTITSGFLKTMQQCKEELNLSENIIVDLYHYWKEDYSLLNRDTGCAILCMSKKLDMIDENGKLHHGNTQEFAKAHGADEDLAAKLVNLIHSCEKQYDAIEDDCVKILEIAKCFRTDIHGLDWAPKVEVIISEVLTDV